VSILYDVACGKDLKKFLMVSMICFFDLCPVVCITKSYDSHIVATHRFRVLLTCSSENSTEKYKLMSQVVQWHKAISTFDLIRENSLSIWSLQNSLCAIYFCQHPALWTHSNIAFVSLLLWYKVIGSLWILAILGDTCSFTTLLYVGKYLKRMHKETHQQRAKGLTACKKEQLVHMYSYIFWRFIMTFLTRIFVCSDFTGIIWKIRNRSGPSCGQGPWRPQEILQEGYSNVLNKIPRGPVKTKVL